MRVLLVRLAYQLPTGKSTEGTPTNTLFNKSNHWLGPGSSMQDGQSGEYSIGEAGIFKQEMHRKQENSCLEWPDHIGVSAHLFPCGYPVTEKTLSCFGILVKSPPAVSVHLCTCTGVSISHGVSLAQGWQICDIWAVTPAFCPYGRCQQSITALLPMS